MTFDEYINNAKNMLKQTSDKEKTEEVSQEKVIGEYFGTLLQSITEIHKKHLMSKSYSEHKALEDYYKEMPGLVDSFIEHYQGIFGIIENYPDAIIRLEAGETSLNYLNKLFPFVCTGYEIFKDPVILNVLKSDIDAICGLISSTMYKIRNLG